MYILGIRDEKARMKVTPPLAVAPRALRCAPDHNSKRAPTMSHKNQVQL